MKKLFILIFCILSITAGFCQYKGDGLGDHKLRRNLNGNGYSLSNILELNLTNGATVQGQITVTSIKFADGTIQISSPTAGGGGGGNKNLEYDFPATSWLVAGYGNAAQIIETSYQVNGATESIWGIRLPASAAPNEAYKQINWSKQWANGAINIYATLASTGVCSGNTWLEMCFSTSPFNSDTYEYSGSTTTLPVVAWMDGVVMATWTITSTTLGDGKSAKVKIRRRNSDASSQDVYVLDVKCAYVVD